MCETEKKISGKEKGKEINNERVKQKERGCVSERVKKVRKREERS